MSNETMQQKDLRTACKQAGIKYGKMSVAQMRKALRSQKFIWNPGDLKQKKTQAHGHAKDATPKNKKPLSAKATLREKFERRGYVTAKQTDQIAEKLNVTRSTVLTAMSDLKNAKYAGKAGPLNIQKDGDGYRLINQPIQWRK